MTHPAVRGLMELIPPPSSGGDEIDWDALAELASSELPEDYRDFVAIYGGGEIDEYVAIATPPVQESAYATLLDGLGPALSEDDQPELESRLPGSSPARLWAFGSTASGDAIFWHCHGPANEWRVVVWKRQVLYDESRWEVFNGGMAEFLLAAFSGAIDPFSEYGLEAESHHYLSWRDV
ncbi:MAG: SMI1/KNR4 family protein [Streptomyces sp.]|nr:SMI1/KNR4 family protein [Streptomyces sp.]